MKPATNEFGEYYQHYISLVQEEDVLLALLRSKGESMAFWDSISEAKSSHQYDKGKWSIKQLLVHITDTERIFGYRALSFARGEKQSLLGYDHDQYALNSITEDRSYNDIRNDHRIVRESSLALFRSFNSEQLSVIGIANDLDLSVRAIGFILVGHETHHMNVVREKYL
jgi:uncharacterized damage-inducible protein DinB